MQNEIVRGIVRRVFFSNAESPAMAGVLAADDGIEIRFAGKCYAQIGDRLELTGAWGVHPKFGRQFTAETGLVKMDESPDALVHLLATDARFKGLGPARARKVVDAALALSADGEMASALREYSAEIAARAKVPLEIVENAAAVWNERRTYFDSLALLCGQGWSNAQAQSIVHVFGENAPSIVKDDPYLLIKKIPRFGFRTVDAVALKMGMSKNAPTRLAAGLAYCLDQMGGDGSTWTTREALIDISMGELRPDTLEGEDRVREMLDEMIRLGFVHLDVSPIGTEVVADARMAAIEFEVFEWLLEGMGDGEVALFDLGGPRAATVIPTLNAGQLAALTGFSARRMAVISGGAGVGKTYTMRAICEVAEENGLEVALCAPTGKAARRLAQSTGRDASTIHRLLEPSFDETTGAFRFNRGLAWPIDAGLVVVDEVSMVDVRLMRSLLVAMPPDARLLLVGDHHQIPSVSPGAILRDLLSARHRYPQAVHILDEVVRQAGELARNTSALLGGVVVPTQSSVWGIEHTTKGHEEGAATMVAMLVEAAVCSPEPLKPFDRVLDLVWDMQILSPMKKGPLGTMALNVQLQRLRQRLLGNPPPEPTEEGKRPKPLVGDKVIWTKNDYTLGLFNGTQAVVTALPKGGSMDLFLEDGREVTIPGDKRIHVEVAYALTIHKSQGSEWPFVVMVASSSHWIMRDRNLLYTGASRAAEALLLVGDPDGIRGFAKEQKSAARQTFGGFLVHGWQPKRKAGTLDLDVQVEVDTIAID